MTQTGRAYGESLRAAALILLAQAATLCSLAAQGGRYLGPGDLSRDAIAGPPPPPPPPQQPFPPGPINRGGVAILEDLGQWQFWWELEKTRYLQPATDRPWRPDRTELSEVVAPPLRALLTQKCPDPLRAAALIAAAKVSARGIDVSLLPACERALQGGPEPVAEAALLALGIGAPAEAALDRLEDALEGRRPEFARRRAFAAFGIGVLASRLDTPQKTRVVGLAALRDLLRSHAQTDEEVAVAALHGIGQFGLAPGTDPHATLRQQALLTLLESWRNRVIPSSIRAHVPPLVAKLSASAELDEHPALAPIATRATQRFREALGEYDEHSKSWQLGPARGLVIALGVLAGRRGVPSSEREETVTTILRHYDVCPTPRGDDRQSHDLCLLALGRIGGERAEQRLLLELEHGSKSLDTPWAALGCGLLVRGGHAAAADIGPRMLERMRQTKNPNTCSAIAIGMGLASYTDAAPELRKRLERYKNQDAYCAYLATALALVDDTQSFPALRTLLERSKRRPERRFGLVQALHRDTDTATAEMLLGQLSLRSEIYPDLASYAIGLGHFGNPATARQLAAQAADPDTKIGLRTYATAALGCLAETGPRPWNAAFAEGIDYRAVTRSMTDQVRGLLDLL